MDPSTRRRQIEMARRRQRPGSGSTRAFMIERTAEVKWPDLTPALLDLPWCAVGAVATRLYMPERSTSDLDGAVKATDAATARQRLVAAGYHLQGNLSIGGTSWQAPGGQIVDLLELSEPWAAEAIQDAQSNRDAQGLPIIPLAYLVLLKLHASRHQDLADLARMLGQATSEQLQPVRSAVKRWRPADLEDLEALIESGRWELRGLEDGEADSSVP